MGNNNQLHSIIKLRHLKSASQNNWETLQNTQKMVNSIIAEANGIMASYGDQTAKENYAIDKNILQLNIEKVQGLLSEFYQFFNDSKTINIDNTFSEFKKRLEETNGIFNVISTYPTNGFKGTGANEWADIWAIIKSNLSIIQGVAESAYIKSLMMEEFNNTEVDLLTNEIVKHIPESFNLLEADKYKKEYLQAIKDIEQEGNAKDNLWDRFLNVLAGNIPFKQTPEERVMMSRWLDGEKGEL